MDITHSFYLPFGEMTITPLDFTAITGLSFSREVVPFNSEAYSSIAMRKKWMKDMFGVITHMKLCCSSLVRYTELITSVRS